MTFQNTSKVPVLLKANGQKIAIMPGETADISLGENPRICFSHDYQSTSMSHSEIEKDDMSATSFVDVLISGYKPAYFQIALDSVYTLQCADDTVVAVQQEKIRPCYACTYDRFYPLVSDGTVNEISHTFREKEAFTKLYKAAVGGNNRRLIQVLVVIAGILTVPFGVLALLANWIVGVVVLLEGGVLAAVYFVGKWIANAISGGECKTVLSDFESDRIAKYYTKMKNEEPAQVQYD